MIKVSKIFGLYNSLKPVVRPSVRPSVKVTFGPDRVFQAPAGASIFFLYWCYSIVLVKFLMYNLDHFYIFFCNFNKIPKKKRLFYSSSS